mgnify:CR=1 FL=1
MTGDDLDGRAVFFALGSPVLVQRRPVGGAEVLADFKAQVIRISEMGKVLKNLASFFCLVISSAKYWPISSLIRST